MFCWKLRLMFRTAKNSCKPTPSHMGKRISDYFTKNILMEGKWNFQICSKNSIFPTPLLIGLVWGSIYQKCFFSRNCIKCLELYRKVMSTNPPSLIKVGLIHNKIFANNTQICIERSSLPPHTSLYFLGKNILVLDPIPIPCGWGWKNNFLCISRHFK